MIFLKDGVPTMWTSMNGVARWGRWFLDYTVHNKAYNNEESGWYLHVGIEDGAWFYFYYK